MFKILSYAQKTFFLHINEETLALSHLSCLSYLISITMAEELPNEALNTHISIHAALTCLFYKDMDKANSHLALVCIYCSKLID